MVRIRTRSIPTYGSYPWGEGVIFFFVQLKSFRVAGLGQRRVAGYERRVAGVGLGYPLRWLGISFFLKIITISLLVCHIHNDLVVADGGRWQMAGDQIAQSRRKIVS